MDDEVRRRKRAEYMREWRARNPEHSRQYMREWSARHPERKEYQRAYNAQYYADPERQEAGRQRAQAWRDTNPDRHRANARRSYERDPQRAYATQKAWKERNRDKWSLYQKAYQARRRARLAEVSIGDVDFAAVLARANGLCQLCGQALGDKWHFDHIVPIARGGPHTQDNLQATHPTCNKRKSARAEWKHLFDDSS